ncbi:hypothetical protein [Bacillus thuringiensis]|nr:hypothetical protein [Bacillus thuringiensis]MCU7667931.1 hypothetical protein [Bacillus thuringiensis]
MLKLYVIGLLVGGIGLTITGNDLAVSAGIAMIIGSMYTAIRLKNI